VRSTTLVLFCVLASSFAGPKVFAQSLDEATESRIVALEAEHAALRAGKNDVELAALKEQVMALEAALQEASDPEALAVIREDLEVVREDLDDRTDSIWDEMGRRNLLSGYMTSYFAKQKDDTPYFRMVKANLLINGQMHSALRFFGEIEFENAAAVGEGRGVVKLEQGYAELKFNQYLGLRMGAVLVPFGYYNLLHEEWRYAFTKRPLVNEFLLPSTYSDVGAGFFGALYSGEDLHISYDLVAINGLNGDFVSNIGAKGLRSSRPAFDADNNAAKSVVGRLAIGITEMVQLGLSGYWGIYENDSASDKANGNKALAMFGLDVLFEYEGFNFRTEGVAILVDTDKGLVTIDDGDSTTLDALVVPNSMLGVVAETEYRFFPAFLKDTFLGVFEDPKFFVAARFNYIAHQYEEGLRAEGDNAEEMEVTGSLGYRPVFRSAIRFEFSKGFLGDLGLGEDWRFISSFALGY